MIRISRRECLAGLGLAGVAAVRAEPGPPSQRPGRGPRGASTSPTTGAELPAPARDTR